jgi:ribulose-5-phosphate 4-epimerase/fuculose-1-phosphate aldolase
VTEARIREDVFAACRVLVGEGLVEAYGHVSARLPGFDRFVVTPRYAPSLLRGPEDLLVVDLDGRRVKGEGDPPLEVWMHTEVYRRRPDVGALCRTHSFAATAWSTLGEPLRPVHGFGAFLGVEVPVFPTPFLITTPELGQGVADSLGDREAVLLRGNGQLVVGRTVAEACVKAIFLEQSARLHLAARAAGRPVVWTAEEVARRTGPDVPYDHFGRAWNYYRSKHAGAGRPRRRAAARAGSVGRG